MHPQVERAARCCRCSDSGMHAWCGHATVMVLVSSASGTHVSGYMRAPRAPNYSMNFGCRACRQRLHAPADAGLSYFKVCFFEEGSRTVLSNPSLLC